MKYKICQKLNYSKENIETQKKVDYISDIIHKNMQRLGYEESQQGDLIIDYVFSVGGDGTMLNTMHHHIAKQSVVIGINAGNVGFLTPFEISDIENQHIFNLIEDKTKQRIEKRSVLEHTLYPYEEKDGVAVNEYAITAERPNDMLDFALEIDYKGYRSKAGVYRANAVIISGPCGSTAYNMNAGGAIVDPTVKCMQIVMIAPTTLGSRPLIVGQNTQIHVRPLSNYKVYSDGILYFEKNENFNEVLNISLKKDESKILVPQDFNFYNMLSKKLHWNNGKNV